MTECLPIHDSGSDKPQVEMVGREEIQAMFEALPDMFPDINPSLLTSYLEALKHEKVIKFGDKFVINTFFPPWPGRAFEKVFNRGLKYPMVTNVVVTNACHGNCNYCSYASPEKPKNADLRLDQLQHIMGQLQTLGVPVIGLTGGEPLLRPDLEDIIASIDDRSSTILFTSGRTPDGPLTVAKARNLKNAGLFMLSVSLDHHDPEINDKNRFAGAHATALKAIESALEAGLYTVSSIVVTEANFEALEKYIQYMGRVGVHGIRVLDIVPSGACIDQPPLSPAKRAQVVEIHKRVNADPSLPQLTTFSHIEGGNMFGCGAGGIHHMFVDGEGKLRPCDFVPIVFGDLTKEPLAAVYGRMRKVFALPERTCLMKGCHAAISEVLGDRQVVNAGEVEALLMETRGRCNSPGLCEGLKSPDR